MISVFNNGPHSSLSSDRVINFTTANDKSDVLSLWGPGPAKMRKSESHESDRHSKIFSGNLGPQIKDGVNFKLHKVKKATVTGREKKLKKLNA